MENNNKEENKVLKAVNSVRRDTHKHMLKLQTGGKSLVLTVLIAMLVMFVAGLAIFFAHIRGPERVMVPDVRGKILRKALIDMQDRELYPKIVERYSDVPGDENTVLEQNPVPGSIVRGYSRVNLVVSRGAVVQELENFVGRAFKDVEDEILAMFAGASRNLIIVDKPEYKADSADEGIILAQNLPEGTKITEPVKLKFVVSSGQNYQSTEVPWLIGRTVEDMYKQMATKKIVFDYTSHVVSGKERPGTVTATSTEEEPGILNGKQFIKNYSRMTVDFAFPRGEYEKNIYGIFTDNVITYPYPVKMSLVATDKDGNQSTLVEFSHDGGKVTVPYAVEKGTILTLFITEKEHKKISVN